MSDLNENLNKSANSCSGNGEITFTNEVIATIIGTCISDIEGLSEVVGGNVVDGITGIFGKKSPAKGIKVEVGKEEVSVSMSISVVYGFNIPKVCADIHDKVSKSIESMTGLKVIELNINVANITVDDSKVKSQTSSN